MVALELCTLDLKWIDCRASGEKKVGDVRNKVEGMRGRYSNTLLDLILGLLKAKPGDRKGLRYVQEVLEGKYGGAIKMERHGKGVQVGCGEESGEMKRVRELEKELQVRREMERHYQERIFALEEREAGVMKVLGPKKSMQECVKEMKGKWGDLFKFTDKLEKGIGICLKNYIEVKKDTMEGLMQDLMRIGKDSGYEKVEQLAFVLKDWHSEGVNSAVKEIISSVGDGMKDIAGFHLSLEANDEKKGYITNETVEEVAHSIGTNLKSLKKLTLDFSCAYSECGQIHDKGLYSFSARLFPSLSQIQELSLSFSGNGKITDQGFSGLASRIGPNLKTLRCLLLYFSSCPGIRDTGVKELANSIGSHLSNLQELSLDFKQCSEITDAGLREMAVRICPNLPGLQKFRLDFRQCIEIKDEGLKALASQIGKNLTSLCHLTLLFDRCFNISDKSIQELALASSNLKDLLYLQLSFAECENITDKGFSELLFAISSNLKGLQKVQLDFSGIEFSAQTLDLVEDYLVNVPEKEIAVSQ